VGRLVPIGVGRRPRAAGARPAHAGTRDHRPGQPAGSPAWCALIGADPVEADARPSSTADTPRGQRRPERSGIARRPPPATRLTQVGYLASSRPISFIAERNKSPSGGGDAPAERIAHTVDSGGHYRGRSEFYGILRAGLGRGARRRARHGRRALWSGQVGPCRGGGGAAHGGSGAAAHRGSDRRADGGAVVDVVAAETAGGLGGGAGSIRAAAACAARAVARPAAWRAASDGATPRGPARFGPARFGSARFGSARFGSARFGSARFGSARFGSARFGSARFGRCECAGAELSRRWSGRVRRRCRATR
jgi:hypothetical protein